jgi:hypothetical protein
VGPFIYSGVDALQGQPLAGKGTCVDIIKHYVQGLRGMPTTTWTAGMNVIANWRKIAKGTAIATMVKGRYPGLPSGNHAAIVVQAMASGIWVMDQWANDAGRPVIAKRLIRIPPPREQVKADGSYIDPSNDALAFFVIER